MLPSINIHRFLTGSASRVLSNTVWQQEMRSRVRLPATCDQNCKNDPKSHAEQRDGIAKSHPLPKSAGVISTLQRTTGSFRSAQHGTKNHGLKSEWISPEFRLHGISGEIHGDSYQLLAPELHELPCRNRAFQAPIRGTLEIVVVFQNPVMVFVKECPLYI